LIYYLQLQSKDTDYDEMEQWLTSDQKKDVRLFFILISLK
jgi:hypothetical protein